MHPEIESLRIKYLAARARAIDLYERKMAATKAWDEANAAANRLKEELDLTMWDWVHGELPKTNE